jgi:hypothetical protein
LLINFRKGKQLKKETIGNCHVSIDDLPAGFYLFRATAGNGRIYSSRVLKE